MALSWSPPQRADVLLAEGDTAGSSTWIRVWRTIEKLRRSPRSGDATH